MTSSDLNQNVQAVIFNISVEIRECKFCGVSSHMAYIK